MRVRGASPRVRNHSIRSRRLLILTMAIRRSSSSSNALAHASAEDGDLRNHREISDWIARVRAGPVSNRSTQSAAARGSSAAQLPATEVGASSVIPVNRNYWRTLHNGVKTVFPQTAPLSAKLSSVPALATHSHHMK